MKNYKGYKWILVCGFPIQVRTANLIRQFGSEIVLEADEALKAMHQKQLKEIIKDEIIFNVKLKTEKSAKLHVKQYVL